MGINLMGSQARLSVPPVSRSDPYKTLVTEFQLPVNAAPLVAVLAAVAATTYLVVLRNSSAGGQMIRIGTAPDFGAPIAGLMLAPGDIVIFDSYDADINAIADGAGALLDTFIYST